MFVAEDTYSFPNLFPDLTVQLFVVVDTVLLALGKESLQMFIDLMISNENTHRGSQKSNITENCKFDLLTPMVISLKIKKSASKNRIRSELGPKIRI